MVGGQSSQDDNTEELILFIEEKIFSHFGVLEKFITENSSIFLGSKFTSFCGKYGFIMGQTLFIICKVMDLQNPPIKHSSMFSKR